ncbi:hypothetical protein B0J12DRAFT_8969 [Macrophomina phaseolina]|uniref:Uncharacterized protein n=1 Tax=Macrophomina phaseolina TaxID=35725 RepID=A0ABQ8GTZ0_9PEZI|nr:hypothetical protein B0J12DRAFT_8969 [Macrophomina phaseolina]
MRHARSDGQRAPAGRATARRQDRGCGWDGPHSLSLLLLGLGPSSALWCHSGMAERAHAGNGLALRTVSTAGVCWPRWEPIQGSRNNRGAGCPLRRVHVNDGAIPEDRSHHALRQIASEANKRASAALPLPPASSWHGCPQPQQLETPAAARPSQHWLRQECEPGRTNPSSGCCAAWLAQHLDGQAPRLTNGPTRKWTWPTSIAHTGISHVTLRRLLLRPTIDAHHFNGCHRRVLGQSRAAADAPGTLVHRPALPPLPLSPPRWSSRMSCHALRRQQPSRCRLIQQCPATESLAVNNPVTRRIDSCGLQRWSAPLPTSNKV